MARIKFKKKHGGIFLIFLIVGFVGMYLLSFKSPPPVGLTSYTPSPTPVKKYEPITDFPAFLATRPLNATDKAKKEFRERIEATAVEVSTVEIKGCTPKPLASKVKENKTLTIKNLDTTAHTISFTEKNTYSIPANGSLDIPATFDKGLGIYTFTCDEDIEPVGVVLTISGS